MKKKINGHPMRTKWKCKFQMTIWKLKRKRKKEKKSSKNTRMYFNWGDGLSLYCTTTLLLRKYFSDLYSVGKI